MRRSTDRILTTHVGSLPRPDDLAEAVVARETGSLDAAGAAQLPGMVTAAVAEVVARQVTTGIDAVSDGELGKIGYATYVKERICGFSEVEVPPGGGLRVADLDDYPGMAATSLAGLVTATPTCTGPLAYVGHADLRTDLDNFRAALGPDPAVEPFVNAASPGVIALYLPNAHYPTTDDYLFAIADAMREEYRAIVDAGFVLQIDAPDLAMGRHVQYPDLDLPGFVRRAEVHVEAINHALRDVDPERVRVHLCYGNYQGPHHRDVELKDILPTVLRLHPHGLVFEAANHRHGHEWRVFEDVAVPAEKVLLPGVIDTSSVYVEHPELVAERLGRFASVVGRERVIAATDCGFASFASLRAVPTELAWAKLASMVEGARIASAGRRSRTDQVSAPRSSVRVRSTHGRPARCGN